MKVISYLVSLAVYDGKGVPISIQAPFSPIDVIEEYTRPARYVENYVEKVLEPLSEPEYVHFEEVGTLEAFNTDGIRSLIQTIKIPNIKERLCGIRLISNISKYLKPQVSSRMMKSPLGIKELSRLI